MIESNCKKVAELVKAGAQLVITTARGAEFEPFIRQKLSMFGITPLYILTGHTYQNSLWGHRRSQ